MSDEQSTPLERHLDELKADENARWSKGTTLDNCQTLCSACHVAKGREDNARRRALKRPGVQLALL